MTVLLNTNNLILYPLIQRFIYQYYTLFSIHRNHTEIKEFTQLWFLNIFVKNEYFNKMPNSVLINYEIEENKDLLIVVKAPLNYHGFVVSLDKPIESCVTYANDDGRWENINIFNIEYKL